MRSFEEIKSDIKASTKKSDVAALERLVKELTLIDVPDARAVEDLTKGVLRRYQGDHDGAMEHYRRALQQYEEIGDRLGLAHATMNMGVLFLRCW